MKGTLRVVLGQIDDGSTVFAQALRSAKTPAAIMRLFAQLEHVLGEEIVITTAAKDLVHERDVSFSGGAHGGNSTEFATLAGNAGGASESKLDQLRAILKLRRKDV